MGIYWNICAACDRFMASWNQTVIDFARNGNFFFYTGPMHNWPERLKNYTALPRSRIPFFSHPSRPYAPAAWLLAPPTASQPRLSLPLPKSGSSWAPATAAAAALHQVPRASPSRYSHPFLFPVCCAVRNRVPKLLQATWMFLLNPPLCWSLGNEMWT
jgi:hypothetical protein